jgi:hypothetical protein
MLAIFHSIFRAVRVDVNRLYGDDSRGGVMGVTVSGFKRTDVARLYRQKRREKLLLAVRKAGLGDETIYDMFFNDWIDNPGNKRNAPQMIQAFLRR